MERENLVELLTERLKEIGIGYTLGSGTDISISLEFLDSKWSTGSKEITYKAFVFVDEIKQTVYMWEMTKETGRGFSFGSEGDSFFQKGKTLYRKVKHVQYGFDGKAYEFELDLGAIPKTIKETAKQHGWKFKTVLSEGKALYPPGFHGLNPKIIEAHAINTANPKLHIQPVLNNQTELNNHPKPNGQPEQNNQPEQNDQLKLNDLIEPKVHPGSNYPKELINSPGIDHPAHPPLNSNPERNSVHGSSTHKSSVNSIPQNSSLPKSKSMIGLIGFILLAVTAGIFFAATDASMVGWILAAFVLSGLWFLNRRRASANRPIAGIIRWLSALLMLFVILVFTTPDSDSPAVSSSSKTNPAQSQVKITLSKALEKALVPSASVTTVAYENLKIHIPGNTLQKDEKLTISKVSGTPKAIEDLAELCPPFDVKLGDLTLFKDPIIIEIPYDKTKLSGLNPEDAFIAVYYDENSGKWMDVPYQADPNAGVVRLQLYHLTTVSCYYSTWEGARVYDNGSALIIYNLHDDDRKLYTQYEEATGKTAAEPTKPQMVVDAAELAKKIIKAYTDAGLTMSGKPKIYLTSYNNYNSSSGNLTLKMNYSANERNPDKLLARDLGHELFHKAQHNTLGWYAYTKTNKTNTSFWMEASADYMGNKGVWLLLGEPPINRYEEIPMLFFERELFRVDTMHEYEAANFVNFVMSKHQATPLQLIQLAEESSVLSGLNFETRFNQIFRNDTYNNLLSYYDGFVEHTFFDNSSRYALKTNKEMEQAFPNHTELKFEPDANNKAKNSVLEGEGKLEVPDDFTAGFYRFTTDLDTTLEIKSDSPLTLYSANRTRTDRGFTKRVMVSGGTPSTINFAKDDYVVIIGTGSTKKTCSFKYKAVPLTISARNVSGLVPIKAQFPNGVTPAFKKDNKGIQVSISKWAQAEKYNLSFQNHGCFYEDSKSDYEISNFNIVNPTQFLLQGNSDGSLYVEGNVDIEFRYWPKIGSGSSQWQTLPITAILTPNNEGYDIRIDINGLISEGKLK